MLTERVYAFIAAGREVMLVGDMNVVASVHDHCEGTLVPQDRFHAHPARQWFRDLLTPSGPLHDTTRHFHPHREKMYTCWNTLIDARPANYGTRLDYILVTSGLMPWIKHADIQPHIYGSDHCPVYVDFFESRVCEGKEVHLKEVMHAEQQSVSRLAASQMDAFSRKTQPRLVDLFSAQQKRQTSGSSLPLPSQPQEIPRRKRQKKDKQTTLAGFFKQQEDKTVTTKQSSPILTDSGSSVHAKSKQISAAAQWSSLFQPQPPPVCTGHQEPAKSLFVTKPGINHGRKFWICARPVGPGYEQRNNTQYRCKYFAWDTDVKRQRQQSR